MSLDLCRLKSSRAVRYRSVDRRIALKKRIATRFMANPKRSVELLNQLETSGFTDEAFALLHHSRVRGRRDTIVSHRSYCEKHSLFQRDGDNERTQRRLEFVLRRYLHGGGSDCRSDIFVELANRAFGEIPPGKIVGKRATAELISHEHRSRRQTSRSIEAPRAHFETLCSFDRRPIA